MEFDLDQLPASRCYKLLASSVVPRPIAWVTSLSAEGALNVAPFSFFNMMGEAPPTIALGILRRKAAWKDTAANIKATSGFVVNLVCRADAEKMNLTSADYSPEIDEAGIAALSLAAAQRVCPPRIATAPVSLECTLAQIVPTGPAQEIIIATVLHVHVADRFILDADRLEVDTPAMELIGRLHGAGWYTLADPMFKMPRPVMSTPEKIGAATSNQKK